MRLLLLSLLVACAATAAEMPNRLTADEQAAGWRLLFDGSTTKGWVGVGKTEFPANGWEVQAGTLHLPKGSRSGDIVTQEQFGDFEFTWEWKISEGGNSGVKYNLPDPQKGVGCEYQLIDDSRHKDAALHDGTRTTASLYDVIARVSTQAVKPAGEWNQSRIVVKGNHAEQYLNGAKTVEFDFGSEDLKKAIAQSKFAKTEGWGIKKASPLLLQDHGDEVWFRNLKIRETR